MAHDHPSGVAEPSERDHVIATGTDNARKLIGVRVLNDFAIGDGDIVSFAERWWL